MSVRPHYNLDAIKAAARGQWPLLLSEFLGISADRFDGRHGPCPRCGGNDRFRFTNVNGDGSCLCNKCFRDGADGIEAILQLSPQRFDNFGDVLCALGNRLGIAPDPPTSKRSKRAASPASPPGKVPPAKIATAATPTSTNEPTNAPYSHERVKISNINESLAGVWCIHKPPITPSTLFALEAKYAEYTSGRDKFYCIAFPIWGSNWFDPEAKPVGYILYESNGRQLPFRTQDRETKQWTTQWQKVLIAPKSQPGIVADRSRLRNNSTHLYKLEGTTDLAAFLSLVDLPPTAAAFTNSSGAVQRPLPWLSSIIPASAETVITIHDADEPGEQGANAWALAIQPIIQANFPGGQSARSLIARIPFPVTPDHGADLRDFLNDDLEPLESGWARIQNLPVSEPVASTTKTTTATPANQSSTGDDDQDPSTPSTPITVIESVDDPLRLARINLTRYQSREGGATLRYWREEWFTWKPSRGCYRHIPTNEFEVYMQDAIREEFERINFEEQAENPKKPPTVRHVTPELTKRVIQATKSLCLLQSRIDLNTWIDGEGNAVRERRPYLAMRNGILDIDRVLADDELEKCLLPHSPNWFSMNCVPYNFDADGHRTQFKHYLNTSMQRDQECMMILQEWAGYLLTPDSSMQKFLALEGEGANGKSVFCAVMTAMLGADSVSNLPLERFAERFDLFTTLGKLLNISSDVGEIKSNAEGIFKSYVGGDVIQFDRKFKTPMESIPTARIMMAFNNRPRFTDKSDGVWRRMILIPWKYQVPKSERVYGMDRAEYWEKSGELPGILNWALVGLKRLREQGDFTESKAAQAAKESYQREMNPTKAFLMDHVREGQSTDRIGKSQLFEAYRFWCQQNNHRESSKVHFCREVVRLFKSVEALRVREGSDRVHYFVNLVWKETMVEGREISSFGNDQELQDPPTLGF